MFGSHSGYATTTRIIELLEGKPGSARVRLGTKSDDDYPMLVDQGLVNEATLAILTGETPEAPATPEQGVEPRRPRGLVYTPQRTSPGEGGSSSAS